MSVRFIQGDGRTLRIGTYGGQPGYCTLFGQPFPPDDVKAYWSLVPMEIFVEWSPALGIFFVTRNLSGFEEPHQVRRQIMATEAHKLSVWMETIAALVNGSTP